MKKNGYSIRIAAQRTGLSEYTIRAWERRYKALIPVRISPNRRVYNDKEIDKLLLLKKLTDQGHRIRDIARHSFVELSAILSQDQKAKQKFTNNYQPSSQTSPDEILQVCISALEKFNAELLEETLRSARYHFSVEQIIQNIVEPLMQYVGNSVHNKTLGISNEHFASAIIRNFLSPYHRIYPESSLRPIAVITTPLGELHEMGALVTAIKASSQGWCVRYLGASLPADDIFAAIQQGNVKAVALSIPFLRDDPKIGDELFKLREIIPQEIAICVGGRAALSYIKILKKAHIALLKNFQDFNTYLKELISK